MRKLTGGDRDGPPVVVTDTGWVYFLQPSSTDSCLLDLWRVRESGGPASRVTQVGRSDGSTAMTRDGRLLAYATLRNACAPHTYALGLDEVVVVNLVTGRRHVISVQTGAPASLAWGPGGRTLAVGEHLERDQIHLFNDPFAFTASAAGSAPALPCPAGTSCWQDSPSFSRDGALLYLAAIDNPLHSCLVSVCQDMTYDVVIVRGGSAVAAVSQRARAGVETTGTVDAGGGAVIYNLPSTGGGASVWRWVEPGPPEWS
ncbi:MAG: hypothetical protein QOI76_2819 [Frankiales bacterium]|nr:hypothetical protein [Frankiales bacterium]